MDFKAIFNNIYAEILSKNDQNEIRQPKMLWTDQQCLQYVNAMCTQTELAKDDIPITVLLSKATKMQLCPHATVFVFCRPTMENALLLAAVLKDTRKRIKQMFLTFSNSVQDSVMECIAQSDKHHLV